MATKKNETRTSPDANPDAITGAPGSHPVETGVGAAIGGAAAGAAAGAVAGPAGVVVGAAVGAVAGGYAGKAVGESIDPTAEDAFWRENYRNRPYVSKDTEYEHYRPAYQYGWESRSTYHGKSFDEMESELEQGWQQQRANSTLNWSEARHATRRGPAEADSAASIRCGLPALAPAKPARPSWSAVNAMAVGASGTPSISARATPRWSPGSWRNARTRPTCRAWSCPTACSRRPMRRWCGAAR